MKLLKIARTWNYDNLKVVGLVASLVANLFFEKYLEFKKTICYLWESTRIGETVWIEIWKILGTSLVIKFFWGGVEHPH